MASAFVVTAVERHRLGDRTRAIVTGNFSVHYRTGGDTITAAQCGLGKLSPNALTKLDGQTIDGTKTWRYDASSGLILLYDTAGSEAGDDSDQHLIVIRFEAVGY